MVRVTFVGRLAVALVLALAILVSWSPRAGALAPSAPAGEAAELAAGAAPVPADASFVLQRWATQSGEWLNDMRWSRGDFNGDGRDDLATWFNHGGSISYDVHASTGVAFARQRWATQSGAWLEGMLWFVGDFTGDGKDDVVVLFEQGGQVSMDVNASTGTTFARNRWITQQGTWYGGTTWLVGDFNGDGRDDLSTRYSQVGQICVDVYLSTGSAFVLQPWSVRQGDWLPDMVWFAGDFDGDGRCDLANLFNQSGSISIDVRLSFGTTFAAIRWATQSGGWLEGMLWRVGDYNGDGRDDLCSIFNHGGSISMDVHASTGNSFARSRWATQQGAWIDGMIWFPGDFNGDGRDDIAVHFNHGGKNSVDVHASTGNAFVLQRWATQQGNVIAGMWWFLGDYDRDGKQDLATRWHDAGYITIDVLAARVTYRAHLPMLLR